jgi:uncharacterized membrane protein YbhN (UPF0104 family)
VSRRQLLNVLLLVVLVLGSFWWVLREVNVDDIWQRVTSASPLPTIIAVVVVIASHAVRAYRWRWLLPESPTLIPLRVLFSAVMSGYAWSTIVPRSGELVRPFIVARRTQLPFSVSLMSVVIERTIDVVTLILAMLLSGVLARNVLLAMLPGATMQSLILTLIVPIVLLALVVTMMAVSPLRHKLEFVVHVLKATQSLTGTQRWMNVLLATVLMWFLYAVPLLLIADALNMGHPSSVAQAILLLVIISVGVTIAPTPGALGLYHAFCSTALTMLFDYSAADGMAFAVLAWTVNYGSALIIGGLSFVWELRDGISLTDIRALRRNVRL